MLTLENGAQLSVSKKLPQQTFCFGRVLSVLASELFQKRILKRVSSLVTIHFFIPLPSWEGLGVGLRVYAILIISAKTPAAVTLAPAP